VTRRRRTLKDDEEVLDVLHDAGIPRERVLGVDADKVDDALAVTELSESAVYEIDEREYVRKAEVDEEVKRTRLQGLKDRLATSEDPEVASLRGEIEELEDRIEELTGFDSAQQYYTQS
jgi:polyhydroxyalkanoate synthesis regulator phasin